MIDGALGFIEVIGLSSAIMAADAGLKSANVRLIGYENTRGQGYIVVKFIGDLSAVTSAISAARGIIGDKVVAYTVIKRPMANIHTIFTNDAVKEDTEMQKDVYNAPNSAPDSDWTKTPQSPSETVIYEPTIVDTWEAPIGSILKKEKALAQEAGEFTTPKARDSTETKKIRQKASRRKK